MTQTEALYNPIVTSRAEPQSALLSRIFMTIRLLACHLATIILLLLKIWKTRSCAGISGKSQILFLVVFVTRYLDLVTNFVSIYNTSMKIFFISSAAATVYLMYFKFKATYDGNHDTFRVEFLLGPALLLISHSSRSSSHSVHKNFQVLKLVLRVQADQRR